MWNIAFEGFTVFLLVFGRISGMILANPIFSRRNLPTAAKMGFILCLTVLIAPTVDPSHIAGFSDIEIIFALLKELSVGFACGFVFQLFYYLLFFTGDFLDMQLGLSMAKIFDPGTNIQASVTGNLLSIFFMLYIFATDSHLLMIKIFASSYQIVPVGATAFGTQVLGFIMDLFISVFTLALKLALPFVIAELVAEIAVGILMKVVPQIHVFVINIQLKLVLGILLLFLFAYPVSDFLDNYMISMLENMEKMLFVYAG